MGGPKKVYKTMLILPITPELKEKLREKAGTRRMSEVVRELISEYIKKEN